MWTFTISKLVKQLIGVIYIEEFRLESKTKLVYEYRLKTWEPVGEGLDKIDTTSKRLVIESNGLVLVLLREGCCQCFLTASAFHRSMNLERESETHSPAPQPPTGRHAHRNH